MDINSFWNNMRSYLNGSSMVMIIVYVLFLNNSLNAQCNLTFNTFYSAFGVNSVVFETQFDLAGIPIERYVWDFGDGYYAAHVENMTSHDYSAPGGYEVILKVIDWNNNVCIDTFDLNVINDTPCGGALTAYASPKIWNEFTLESQANGTPPYTYSWSTGSTDQSSTFTLYNAADEICLSVGDANSCYQYECDSIFKISSPLLIEEYYQTLPTAGCDGVLAVSDSLFYDYCQGVLRCIPEGSVDINSMWTSNDTIYFNTCGPVEALGIVDKQGPFIGPLCSTTYLDSTANIPEMELVDVLQIYPNPSEGAFQIQLSNEQDLFCTNICLLAPTGEKVWALSNKFLSEIDLLALPDESGIYFLQLTSLKHTIRKKVIRN